MLLLVTGASGVGKSTVRQSLEPHVAPQVECVELADVSPPQGAIDLHWRQCSTERAVKRAAQLQGEGRHLLLCGDPVAAVEAVAAPSAPELEGLAVCLLHADADAQAERLARRGDDHTVLVHHQAFAAWMRSQATDPLHRLEVVTINGWQEMRWDRIPRIAPQWHIETVDSTRLSPDDTAAAVLVWLRAVLVGQAGVMHVTDPRPAAHVPSAQPS